MSPEEKGIVRKKLAVIIENLRALAPIEGMDLDSYGKDLYKRKATERLLQELIEAAIDINAHLIAQQGGAVPDNYYECFIRAGELRILPAGLAKKLAPSAGVRNRLVHEYDTIKHALVLEAVAMVEELYPEYIKEIEKYISKK